ncbi:hypothetical protein ACH52_0332 [Eubacterium limosum]|nr:hypothetical protein ACH52_0332 [Eubacterium limosum]
MKETKRDLLGQLAINNQLGCVQCALEMGQEVPITFYQAFCEGCCKNQSAIKMDDGLRAFQAMGVYEQAKNLETMKRRIAALLEQYEASLQIYGKKTQEDLKRKMEAEACKRARCLSCLSGVLDDAVCPADIKLPPKGRKGGAW